MVKYFKNLLSMNHWADFDETLYKLQRPKLFISCSNYDPFVGLDLFYGKVIFCKLGFYNGKCDNVRWILWKLLHHVTWHLVSIVN